MKTKSIIQYESKEINITEIEKEIKRLWAAEGKLIKEIQTISAYIKPIEDKCYYVINDIVTGSFTLDVDNNK